MNNLTEEQIKIVNCDDKVLLVKALAGSGKTSTLIEWCKIRPHYKIMYVVFSKSMSDEAKIMFKDNKNVEVRTTHSLAFKGFGTKYKSKLTQSYRAINCMKDLGINGDYDTANDVLRLFNIFLASDSMDIGIFVEQHLRGNKMRNEGLIRKLVGLCEELWKESLDLKSDVKVTHDFYLKLYQMSCPDLGLQYDAILLDECVHGDMYVVTEEGDKKIRVLHERYQNGEHVPRILSYNDTYDKYEYKDMNFSKVTHNREILTIKTEGLNSIKVTGNHPILTQRGYVESDQLICGSDYIFLDTPENQKSKVVLNDDQNQILIGSFLGDGHVDKRSKYNTYRLSFTQGEKQKKYLEFKCDIFNIKNIKNIKSGYTGKMSVYQSSPSSTFILNEDLIGLTHDMDERALAIWYMDDGSYSKESGCCCIHSNAFNEDEHLFLQFVLKNNFGINAVISKNKGYYYLRFNKEDSDKLLLYTRPYMHSDLYYKNPLCYEFDKYEIYKWDNKFKSYGGNFVTSIESTDFGDVYDIGVEDNHNFIIKPTRSISSRKTTGVIVHNCQDSTLTIKGILDTSTTVKHKILIGDPFQSIFSFRNCVNLLDMYPDATQLELTGSFRVNQDISSMCSMLIGMFKNKKINMMGYNQNQKIYSSNKLNFENMQGRFNIITRTNATILAHALEASSRGMWLFFEGGVKSYPFQFYKDLFWFRATNQTMNRELKKFKDWRELQEYAKEAEDVELLTGINFINIYSKKFDSLPKAIDKVFNYVVERRSDAQFCYCTAHKSKGLTFHEPVLIESDFPSLIKWSEEMDKIRNLKPNEYLPSSTPEKQLENIIKQIEQEVNLIYVAMTRAKSDVYFNEDLYKFFNL